MDYYSENEITEYWVKLQDGSIECRLPESNLTEARNRALNASGSVLEVRLVPDIGQGLKVIYEVEI